MTANGARILVVQGSGLRFGVSGFEIWGLGLRNECSGFWIEFLRGCV